MRVILLVLSAFILISCSQRKDKSKVISIESSSRVSKKEPIKSQPEEIVDNRIDLSEILKDEYNTYLATLENNSLDMVSYQVIDISIWIDYSKFEKSIEKVDNYGDTISVNVYRHNDSYLKVLGSDTLICGRIKDKGLLRIPTVKLGMSQYKFMSKYFKDSDTLNEINSWVVYENELGEAWTTYRFQDSQLIEITFDCFNETIKRE